MTFLDFWSTSSALYEVDEGPKDAGAAPPRLLGPRLLHTGSTSGPKVEKGHISPATGSAPDFGTCCLKKKSV